MLDPQTGTIDLERYVAMMYDGASASYSRYINSLVLTRIARRIREEDPKLSLKLTQYAIRNNYFCKPAWELLMEHISSGTLNQKEGLAWFNIMIKKLKKHPDLTMKCLSIFMKCIPEEDIARRQKLYEQAFSLYRKRPDLQIRLRIAQCSELAQAGQASRSISIALKTCLEHAGEGALILPLLEQCVETARKHGVEKKLLSQTKRIDSRFPKKRGDNPSLAYAEFRDILNSLR